MVKKAAKFDQVPHESTLGAVFAIEVLSALTAHIAVLDSQGVIILVNEAWRRFARESGGDGRTAYIGTNYLAICRDAALRGDEAAEAVLQGLCAVLGGEQASFSFEYPCRSPSEERWFILQCTLCGRAESAHLVLAHEDITARKKAENELLRTKDDLEKAHRELQRRFESEQLLARTDALTQVSNRRYFFELAQHEFAMWKRYRHPLSAVLLDLDHFKRINDTWGHQAGDGLLKRVAEIARHEIRESDVLARYGGDELILLLCNSDAQKACIVADRIRTSVAVDGIDTGAGIVRATLSVGVAGVLPLGDTLEQLVRRADEALYEAKAAGRNRTVVFSPL